ncbi:MAG: TIGR03619 family F420-dependent LLM class oxidoreductase [Deltaproteobacteria bacterium]|jgi:probable F420-dependent oxidoreductase|nr:TIGR03619 family F420-dependent LLM class oxidoreductase [Deltaproteobacteria bacterium]MBW2498898.1 TIGR03619 family F420-dependent LLM class oxidoreductase [Deltaproteobacteria bacterium]
MQFWQAASFEHPDELLEIAPVAEEAGFEGVMLADHVFAPEHYDSRYPYDNSGKPPFDGTTPFPEVWSTISALGQVTEKLRFLTNVFILPLRHPIEIARGLGTAAIFSKNRAVLGLGAGWLREEFEILGATFEKRGKRMDEQIRIIQALLTGEITEFKGEFYSFPPLQLQPAPTEKVPMWIGGMNKAALRRAGQYGDGWSGAGTTFEQTEALLQEVAAQRKRFGREKEPFDCLIPLAEELPPEKLDRLVELGMTGTVNWPFTHVCPPNATTQDKLDAMRRFGETVIQPTNG